MRVSVSAEEMPGACPVSRHLRRTNSERPRVGYGLSETPVPVEVIVAAVTSFQLGLIVEGSSNVTEGHAALSDRMQDGVDSPEADASRAGHEARRGC